VFCFDDVEQVLTGNVSWWLFVCLFVWLFGWLVGWLVVVCCLVFGVWCLLSVVCCLFCLVFGVCLWCRSVYEEMKQLNVDEEWGNINTSLHALRDSLVHSSNVVVNITSDTAGITMAEACVPSFVDRLPTRTAPADPSRTCFSFRTSTVGSTGSIWRCGVLRCPTVSCGVLRCGKFDTQT
jgi:hypothetical protein